MMHVSVDCSMEVSSWLLLAMSISYCSLLMFIIFFMMVSSALLEGPLFSL